MFDAQKVQIRDLAIWVLMMCCSLQKGRARGDLYDLPIKMNQKVIEAALSCEKLSHYLWHCRLGHLN